MTGVSRYLCVLLCCMACNQAVSVTNSVPLGDTGYHQVNIPLLPVITSADSATIRYFRKRMEAIDDSVYYYQTMRAMLDTVPLELQLYRKRPVKLRFGQHGTYYFSGKGDVFARQLFWHDENIVGQFFLQDTAVIEYKTTLFKEEWPMLRADSGYAGKRKAGYRKHLDTMMKRFPGVGYRLR